jgi:hypothetical protein
MLESLQDSAGPYRDLEFPPEKSSISHDLAKYAQKRKWNVDDITWLTSRQLHELRNGGSASTVCQTVSPAALVIGKLDGYADELLYAFLTIAQKPLWIRRLIQSKEAGSNAQGCHCVWLCCAGEWLPIILDDFFPFEVNSCSFLMVGSTASEIWCSILEKGLAKYYGGYESLEKCSLAQLLQNCLGVPVLTFDKHAMIAKGEEIFVEMKRALSRMQYVTCWLLSSMENRPACYCQILEIIDFEEHHDADLAIVHHKIVKVKTMHGSVEWKSEWARNGTKFSEAFRKSVNIREDDQDVWWFSAEELKLYLEQIYIVQHHDNYIHFSLKMAIQDKSPSVPPMSSREPGDETAREKGKVPNFTFMKFRLTEKTHMYLSYHHSIDRSEQVKPESVHGFDSICTNIGNDFPFTKMLLVKCNANLQPQKFIAGAGDSTAAIHLEADLDEGDYLITFERSGFDKSLSYTVTTYAERLVQLSCLEFSSFPMGEAIFKEIILLMIVSSLEVAKSPRHHILSFTGKENNIVRYTDYQHGYTYMYYKNMSDDRLLFENLYYTTKKDICMHFPVDVSPITFSALGSQSIQVGPSDTALILFSAQSKNWALDHYTNFQLFQDFIQKEKLIEEILKDKQKIIQRKYKNEAVQVVIYQHFYPNGVGLYYVNQSDKIYEEICELTMDNLKFVTPAIDNKVKIRLAPQETVLIWLRKIDPKRLAEFSSSYVCRMLPVESPPAA